MAVATFPISVLIEIKTFIIMPRRRPRFGYDVDLHAMFDPLVSGRASYYLMGTVICTACVRDVDCEC